MSPFDVAAALDPDVVLDTRMFAGCPSLGGEDRLQALGARCGFAVELDAEPRRHGSTYLSGLFKSAPKIPLKESMGCHPASSVQTRR